MINITPGSLIKTKLSPKASLGPAVFILAASYAGCNRTLTVVFFIIAMGFMGAYYAGNFS